MSRLALAFGFGALRDAFVRVEAKSLALCRHVDVAISVSSSWESLLASRQKLQAISRFAEPLGLSVRSRIDEVGRRLEPWAIW